MAGSTGTTAESVLCSVFLPCVPTSLMASPDGRSMPVSVPEPGAFGASVGSSAAADPLLSSVCKIIQQEIWAALAGTTMASVTPVSSSAPPLPSGKSSLAWCLVPGRGLTLFCPPPTGGQ